MKKGTLLSIALVGLLGFGVASCDSTSNPTSVAPTTSEATAKYTSVAITNKDDLSAEWHVGEANRQVAIESSPALNVNEALKSGELTITSSDANIVGVIGSMLVANGVGTATVTISLDNGLGTKLTDTVDLTIAAVTPLRRESKTIAEMVEIISAQEDKVIYKDALYTVSGYALNVVDSKYGNFDLYDETGKNMITVYGASTTASCIVVEKIGDVEASANFVNPKDFKGPKEDQETAVKDGDFVTMTVVTEKYGSKNEVMGHISNIVKAGSDDTKKTLTASVTAGEGGTATLSKTSGIYLGEELTVTVAPGAGKMVEKVVANGKTLTADSKNENLFKFNAAFTNEVVVSFVDADFVRSTLTTTALNVGSEVGDSEGVVDEVKWIAKGMVDSRGDFKFQPNAYIYNETATATNLKKVTINMSSNNYANENIFKVTFSTEANGAGTKEEVIISTSKGVTSYVATPSAKFNFVTISYNLTQYTAYFKNITVDTDLPGETENTTTMNFKTNAYGIKNESQSAADTEETTNTVEGLEIASKNVRHKGTYLMMYSKFDKTSYFYTKTATATKITKITITFTGGQYGTSEEPLIYVNFGNEIVSGHKVTGEGKNPVKGGSIEFEVPENVDAKYFNISVNSEGKKNAQFETVVIHTEKAA